MPKKSRARTTRTTKAVRPAAKPVVSVKRSQPASWMWREVEISTIIISAMILGAIIFALVGVLAYSYAVAAGPQ